MLAYLEMQHAIRKRSYDSPTVAPAVVSVRNFKKIEVSKIVKLVKIREYFIGKQKINKK